jgi:hypothetical protein
LTRDPTLWLKQAALKLRAMWAPALPEWSVAHQLGQGAYFAALYVLALVGALSERRNAALLWLFGLGIGSVTVLGMLTFVDYDQRYRVAAEVFVIPLSAAGLVRLLGDQVGRLTVRPPSLRHSWRA